jgi:hypothetical protein
VLSSACPPHRGLSWSHHRRPRATQMGAKRKAAPRRVPQKSAAESSIKAGARKPRPSGHLCGYQPIAWLVRPW